MLFLYHLSIWLFDVAVKVVSPFREKARLFRTGRKHLFARLAVDMEKRQGLLIWIHAASLGEFEQGRPILEQIKKCNKEVQILFTFFSPSGYEVRKHYELADFVYYLPLDIGTNANKFISMTKPNLAILIKYDLWYGYLEALYQRKIPLVMVSAVFRKDQLYFRPYGKFFLPMLRQATHYYLQNESSGRVLESQGISQYTVVGDTRFDRVQAVAAQGQRIEALEQFKGSEKLMVLGSVWKDDLKILNDFIKNHIDEMKFIIAPHNINEAFLQQLVALPDSILLSRKADQNLSRYRILIIDSIGLLSAAYKYGEMAYVGGGLHGGLHNVLEAAVYGIPVFFGKHQENTKFSEAVDLINLGGAFEVSSKSDVTHIFERFQSDKDLYIAACKACEAYVREHAGATDRIMSDIKRMLSPKDKITSR